MHNFESIGISSKKDKSQIMGEGSVNAAFLSLNKEDNDPLKKNPAYIGGLLNGSIIPMQNA